MSAGMVQTVQGMVMEYSFSDTTLYSGSDSVKLKLVDRGKKCWSRYLLSMLMMRWMVSFRMGFSCPGVYCEEKVATAAAAGAAGVVPPCRSSAACFCCPLAYWAASCAEGTLYPTEDRVAEEAEPAV